MINNWFKKKKEDILNSLSLSINSLKMKKRTIAIWTVVSLGYFVLVLFYWAPFSWNSMPFHDKWSLDFQNTSFFHFSSLFTIIGTFFQARTHVQDIYDLGHLISSNSFIGYNIVLAGIFFLKSLFTFALTKKIFNENRFIAFLAGVFVSIWATDPLWFELDFTAYHLGSLLLIIAIYLFISYYQKSRLYLFILAIYILMWSLSIIEHAIFPALLAPIIILILEKKITKRLVIVSLIWWVPSLVKLFSFGLSLFLQSPTRSYELNMVDHSNPLSISVIWQSIKYCYSASFSLWISRFNKSLLSTVTPETVSFCIFSGILVAFVIVILYKIIRKNAIQDSLDNHSNQLKKYLPISIFCLCSIYIAYFLFVPTTARFSNIRTFIYSSTWIGISVAFIIWLLSSLIKKNIAKLVVFTCLASFMTVIVVFSSLIARTAMHYHTNLLFGETIPIYEKIPAIKANTVIVIIDNTPEKLGFSYGQKDTLTQNRMIRLAYNDNSLFTVICRNNVTYCRFEKDRFIADALPKGLTPGAIIPIETFEEDGHLLQAFTYDRIVILSYKSITDVKLLYEIPVEYADSELNNLIPETYKPLENISDQGETNFSNSKERLRSFFGYALDYLVKRNILSPQRVTELIGN